MLRFTCTAAILLILLLASVISHSSGDLNVTTSKTVYLPGEELTISGRGTPGGLITVIVYAPGDRIVSVDQAKCDYEGNFKSTPLRFPTQPGDAFPFGEYKVYVKDALSGEEALAKVTFARAAITITGVVIGYDGKPVANAGVTLVTPSNIIRTSTTSSDGTFSFEESELGLYKIKVAAAGYEEETLEVPVDYAPTSVSISVSLSKPRLSIQGLSINVDGRPFTGSVKEGEEIRVILQVVFAGQLVGNAAVNGSIACTSGERYGLGFEYDERLNAYSASFKIPVLNQDRACNLTVEAYYRGLRQSVETGFSVLVNLADLQSKLLLLEERVTELERSVNQTSVSLRALNETLGEIQAILASLNSAQLAEDVRRLNETVNSLRKSIEDYATKDDISGLQERLAEQISTLQHQVALLQQAMLTLTQSQQSNTLPLISLGLSLFAAIIAALLTVYIYRKIAV